AKLTAIKYSKDLTSLSLDEPIENLKVHKMIIKKDSEIVKAKGERKSLALKAKKESSDEELRLLEVKTRTFQRSRDDKNGISDRKCFRCRDPNHLIEECPNHLRTRTTGLLSEDLEVIAVRKMIKRLKTKRVSCLKYLARFILLNLEKPLEVDEHNVIKASEDLGKLKPKADIGIFIGYYPAKKACRIYHKRTRMITKTIHVKFDELTTMDFKQFGSGPEPNLLTPEYISLRLVQNASYSTPYAPPSKKDRDILFQPLFDKYFQPPPSVVSHVLFVADLVPTNTTGTPSSTTIDQDSSSASTSPTTEEIQAPVIHQGVEE
nr:integrase, catalytic region, zinc finger, CCHC-type, peptidase aspartic, catalytic [Tanacetum cinerariifolium]